MFVGFDWKFSIFSSTELHRAGCVPWNCQPSVYLLCGVCLCRQPLAFRVEQSLVRALPGFVRGEQLWWISGVYILLLWLGLNLYTKPSNWLHCGNKMPTRCNSGFYCGSYCLFNMFRAPLCPSSGAQEYYTVVAACGISCCGFQVAGLVRSWGLCVRFAGSNHYNTLELLMMGIVLPETCWASNKICNKNLCCI